MEKQHSGDITEPQAPAHVGSAHDRVAVAARTIAGKMHAPGVGHEGHAAGWAAHQVRHLLGLLDDQVGRIEVALPRVRDDELRAALDVVLADAAARCGTLSRDLDIARGEPLGEPERDWSAHVRDGHGAPGATAHTL